jgi:hypothetical protein
MLKDEFGQTVYVRVQHNQTHIFVLLDLITSLDNGDSEAVVCLDTKDDGGNTPLLDDYAFYCDTTQTLAAYQGNGQGGSVSWTAVSKPAGAQVAWSFSYSNDPYETSNHEIYELQIPVKFLGDKYSYGFYVATYDEISSTFLEYPVTAQGYWNSNLAFYFFVPAPGNWGDIRSDIMFKSEVGAAPTPTPMPTPTPTSNPTSTPTFTAAPTPTPIQGSFPTTLIWAIVILIAAVGTGIVGFFLQAIRRRRSRQRLQISAREQSP